MEDRQRVILRADDNRSNDRDHIVCIVVDSELAHNLVDVFGLMERRLTPDSNASCQGVNRCPDPAGHSLKMIFAGEANTLPKMG